MVHRMPLSVHLYSTGTQSGLVLFNVSASGPEGEVSFRPGADIDQTNRVRNPKDPPTGERKVIRGSGWHEPVDRIGGSQLSGVAGQPHGRCRLPLREGCAGLISYRSRRG